MTQIYKRYSFDADQNDWDDSSILEATKNSDRCDSPHNTLPSDVSWIERVVGIVDNMTVCFGSTPFEASKTVIDNRQDIFRRASKPIDMEGCSYIRKNETSSNSPNSTKYELSLWKSRPIQMSPPFLAKNVSIFSDSTQKWQNITSNRSCETVSTASLSIIDHETDDDGFSVNSSKTVMIRTSLIEDFEEWGEGDDHINDEEGDDEKDDGILFDCDHSSETFLAMPGMKKFMKPQQQDGYSTKKSMSPQQNLDLLIVSVPLVSTRSPE